MYENIKYTNHLGETLQFGLGIYANYNDLRNFAWSYDTDNDIVSNFRRGISSKTLPFFVMGNSEEEAIALKNEAFEIFEKDVLGGIPGALWINGYYYKCYVVEGATSDYLADKRLLQKQVKIVSDKSAWTKETEYFFNYTEISTGSSYPYGYDFGYPAELGNGELLNPDIADSNFKMIFYGPATNPVIYANGHTYEVTCTLAAGEYLEIDSINKTIYQVATNGTRTNMFNYRNKTYSIFKKIPYGVNTITWPETFNFTIVLIEERGEPKWI